MTEDKTKKIRRKIKGLGLRYGLQPARDVACRFAVGVEETGKSHDMIETRV
jgi:hypothetical protein